MSGVAVAWAQTLNDLSGPAKSVLRELADLADEEHSCVASHQTLAARSGWTPRTVQKHLTALQEARLVRWENQTRPDGSQGRNRYWLAVDAWIDTPSWIKSSGPDEVPQTVVPEELVRTTFAPHKPGHSDFTNTHMPDVSDSSGANEVRTSKDLITSRRESGSLVEELRSSTQDRANLPIRPVMSKSVPRKESARARSAREKAEEDSLDPEKIVAAALGEDQELGEVDSRPPRNGKPQKIHNPDSIPGLLDHWRSKMLTAHWASGLDVTNIKIASKHLRGMLDGGIRPEEIRGMIDRYAADPGIRESATHPWFDFYGKRFTLLDSARERQKEAVNRNLDAAAWEYIPVNDSPERYDLALWEGR